MRLLTLPVIALILLSDPSVVKADNTLRRNLKVAHPETLTAAPQAVPAVAADTIRQPADIILSGYDKPLTASREVLLVTNNSSRTITGLRVAITYRDLSGRELHTAVVDLDIMVPPDATRRVTFPSWDTQKSFYYHLGKKPRTANVTPYSVNCRVIHSLILPPET